MTPMRWVYLGLAIWGAIHPMYYFVTWFQETLQLRALEVEYQF